MDAAGESSHGPTIGFPLGLVLLSITLFCMSLLLASCLHWDKLRSLLLGAESEEDDNSHVQQDTVHSPEKFTPPRLKSKQIQGQSLSVLMPGDQVPKFIALACPSEPPLREKIITMEVQKPAPFPVPPFY